MKKLLVLSLVLVWMVLSGPALAADTLTCWFPPGSKDVAAKTITDALSANSGLTIIPQVAKSYPEILAAFSTSKPQLVYVGSFVQSIINSRKLGTPLVQNANGKEMYSGILIYPAGQEPEAILKASPAQIAFAIGATSGESTAKAATAGKAALGAANHGAAVKAVQDGKAKGAVVKDWWWLANESQYSGLKSYRIPGLSEQRNPDNVLTASKAVSAEDIDKITLAALSSSAAFGDKSVVVPFDASQLTFSLGLMKKGTIDPLTYSW
ncbi:MAG: PhnD/SsuA/transferrin family substrate-binding protein [Desulfuromonadales bacterium]|nr:PhnD/SsuA/transferrin family substrate-binding protein [Desulfuromonadales bacterium]